MIMSVINKKNSAHQVKDKTEKIICNLLAVTLERRKERQSYQAHIKNINIFCLNILHRKITRLHITLQLYPS